MSVTHPLLRYHGGKFRMAHRIFEHFPEHRVYVEPYGGAASVLLRKPRSYAEVYNDMDGEVVGLFRVLRNPAQARELIRLVHLTPYAREEFDLSYITDGDPIEQARRTLFRFAAGYATGAQLDWGTGFRNNTTRAGSTPADVWVNMPQALEGIVERLRGVTIEQKPALEILQIFDNPQTLFYCDPPYLPETRNARNAGRTYNHEMTAEDHEAMATALHQVEGFVVLSGYSSSLYDELFSGWRRIEFAAHADGARDRVECLWISPNAVTRPSFQFME